MFDCKQYLIPWRAGMPVLVMAEKEAEKARREAVGFVPKFALYRKAREAKW